MEEKSVWMRGGSSDIPEQRVKAASDTSSKLTMGKEIEDLDSESSWTWTG
jgi:hypothetical protein